MKDRKYTILVILLLTIIVILVILLVPRNKSVEISNVTDIKTLPQSVVSEQKSVDSKIATWSVYRDSEYGFELKYPKYISINPGTKNIGNPSQTLLVQHSFAFTPNPNADFPTFSASVQVDDATNFVLDLGDRFVSYKIANNTWYSNIDIRDKPTAQNPVYKNLFLSKNLFKPTVFTTTSEGLSVYGKFGFGGEGQDSWWYIIPIQVHNRMIVFTFKVNTEALSGNTKAVQNLKMQFDKDFPDIVKSVKISL